MIADIRYSCRIELSMQSMNAQIVPSPAFFADAMLAYLREVEALETGIASIRGAGTFDRIVLSGIVAPILHERRPFHPCKHNGVAPLLQARMIHDSSSRKRADVKRDGHSEA
jgi:hypothetical protein